MNISKANKNISFLLIIIIAIAFTVLPEDAQAASKRPGQVKGLKVTQTTTSSVSLKWKKVRGAKGYTVYKQASGKYKKIKTLKGKSKISYKNTGLKAATSYKYYVKAYKTKKGKKYYGKRSKIKAVKTKATTTPPTQPQPTNPVQTGCSVGWKPMTGELELFFIPDVNKGAKILLIENVDYSKAYQADGVTVTIQGLGKYADSVIDGKQYKCYKESVAEGIADYKSTISSEATEYEKVIAICDYVRKWQVGQYALDGVATGFEERMWDVKRGDCIAFAGAVAILADSVGLEYLGVASQLSNPAADHYCNMIKADGKWLYVDGYVLANQYRSDSLTTIKNTIQSWTSTSAGLFSYLGDAQMAAGFYSTDATVRIDDMADGSYLYNYKKCSTCSDYHYATYKLNLGNSLNQFVSSKPNVYTLQSTGTALWRIRNNEVGTTNVDLKLYNSGQPQTYPCGFNTQFYNTTMKVTTQ